MHLIVGPTMQKDVCSSCDPLDSSPLQLPGIVSGQTRSWNQSTVWVWQIHRLKGISSREFWAPQFSKGWGCCLFLVEQRSFRCNRFTTRTAEKTCCGNSFFWHPWNRGGAWPLKTRVRLVSPTVPQLDWWVKPCQAIWGTPWGPWGYVHRGAINGYE